MGQFGKDVHISRYRVRWRNREVFERTLFSVCSLDKRCDCTVPNLSMRCLGILHARVIRRRSECL